MKHIRVLEQKRKENIQKIQLKRIDLLIWKKTFKDL